MSVQTLHEVCFGGGVEGRGGGGASASHRRCSVHERVSLRLGTSTLLSNVVSLHRVIGLIYDETWEFKDAGDRVSSVLDTNQTEDVRVRVGVGWRV